MDAAAILLGMGNMPPSADPRAEGRSVDPRFLDPRFLDPRFLDPRFVQTRFVDPRLTPMPPRIGPPMAAPRLSLPPRPAVGPTKPKSGPPRPRPRPRHDAGSSPPPTREERSQAVALVRMSSTPAPTVPASPAPQPADPAVAASRFELDKLGQSAGSKLPCPVLTWVAAIIHTIADDKDISGGDNSLTGLTKTAVYLEGGSGNEVGLQLRFKSLKGPQGDLICRIARKVMEIMGKKDRLRGDMFSDWEALRKHLCEDKGLDLGSGQNKRLPHFSFLWTGLKRGGNQSRDFSQTYFERRFTPGLASLSPDARKMDRKLGGGGNPGLMAHCAMLLARDFPGLYDDAKQQALADIANGLQKKAFQAMANRASMDLALLRQKVPPLAKKQLTKKVADERNATKHAAEAAALHPDLQKWIPAHSEEIARSWLAAADFSNAQIARVEALVQEQGHTAFNIGIVRSVVRSLGLTNADAVTNGSGDGNANRVEWATELAELKSKVTTAEEAQAEHFHALVATSSAPVATGLPSNSNESTQSVLDQSITASVDAAALVFSSSAPAAVQSPHIRRPSSTSNGSNMLTAKAAVTSVGVKRKELDSLEARCESAPDDGLEPEEPIQSHSTSQGRASKVSRPSNVHQARLLDVIGHSDIRAHFLSPDIWGVVGLWRLRGVCRSFRSWSTAQLYLLPRVVALGGDSRDARSISSCSNSNSFRREAVQPARSSLQVLDLTTLSWVGQTESSDAAPLFAALQPLPSSVGTTSDRTSFDWARCSAASSPPFANGKQGQRIVAVVYGMQACRSLESQVCTRASMYAFEWSTNGRDEDGSWRALPELPPTSPMVPHEGEARGVAAAPAVCCLRDGRTLIIGGCGSAVSEQTVLVLAADRSSWSHLPGWHAGAPASRSEEAAMVLLPDGTVFIASRRSCCKPAAVASGQQQTAGSDTAVSTAEIWNPLTDNRTALPPMLCSRHRNTVCILPSGRVAVVGYGYKEAGNSTGSVSGSDATLSGEVYDHLSKTWSPLPAIPLPYPTEPCRSGNGNGMKIPTAGPAPAAVSVPGGVIVVGCASRAPSGLAAAEASSQLQQWAQLYDEASNKWYILPK